MLLADYHFALEVSTFMLEERFSRSTRLSSMRNMATSSTILLLLLSLKNWCRTKRSTSSKLPLKNQLKIHQSMLLDGEAPKSEEPTLTDSKRDLERPSPIKIAKKALVSDMNMFSVFPLQRDKVSATVMLEHQLFSIKLSTVLPVSPSVHVPPNSQMFSPTLPPTRIGLLPTLNNFVIKNF